MSTYNIICSGKHYRIYKLFSGIKQGLPLSPMLFLFYINDLFDFLNAIYSGDELAEIINILIHADDVTIFASSREKAIAKLHSLFVYCDNNKIIPQYSKCEFVVINGEGNDFDPLPLGNAYIENKDYVSLLGSHISQSGNLVDDLNLHMKKRYQSCIKYFNFLRENKLAPLCVKIKVLEACVINSLLSNCESFGNKIPGGMESIYFKLIKATLQVRQNTPNNTVLIEIGLLPLKAFIYCRQLNFF